VVGIIDDLRHKSLKPVDVVTVAKMEDILLPKEVN